MKGRNDHDYLTQIEERAAHVRDSLKQIWNPQPDSGRTNADAVMCTIAWVMGKDFMGGLTVEQEVLIDHHLADNEQSFNTGAIEYQQWEDDDGPPEPQERNDAE